MPSLFSILSTIAFLPALFIPIYSTCVPIAVLGVISANKSYTSLQVVVTSPITLSFGIKLIIVPWAPSGHFTLTSPLDHKCPSLNSAWTAFPTTKLSTVNLVDKAQVTDAPQPFLPAE